MALSVWCQIVLVAYAASEDLCTHDNVHSAFPPDDHLTAAASRRNSDEADDLDSTTFSLIQTNYQVSRAIQVEQDLLLNFHRNTTSEAMLLDVSQQNASGTIALSQHASNVPVRQHNIGMSLFSSASSTGGISMLVLFALFSFVTIGLYIFNLMQQPDETQKKSLSQAASTTDDVKSTFSKAPARRRQTIGMDAQAHMKHYKIWTIQEAEDSMSNKAFVVNMFADLCPPGFLPIAYGLKDTGFIPGAIMLVVFYFLCVHCMYLIANSSMITGQTTFDAQWEQCLGKRTKWVPVAVVILVCFGCNLGYACFYADIFTSVMPAFGLNMPRWMCLWTFTLFPTLPLCLLKNLSALAPSSFFALLAVLYTGVVMCVRCLDKSYTLGGRFYADVPPELQPDVPSSHLSNFGVGSLVLVNMLAMAFLAHYNGCKYYRELADHNPRYFRKCTAVAMGICAVVFAITGYAGYQTFGNASDGVILSNYSPNDQPINVARVGMGFSIIASYPIMFSGLREATIALIKLLAPSSKTSDGNHTMDIVWSQDALSMLMVVFITGCASVLVDAGLVIGVVGAVCGSAIIYIVPCLIFVKAIEKFQDPERNKVVIYIATFLGGLGIVLGIGGCLTSLLLG